MNYKILVVLALALFFLFAPQVAHDLQVKQEQKIEAERQAQLNSSIRGFLESKESPLAQETDFLLEHKHWKLLIAISAIESQYCKRQLGFNCWGIGGDSAYRHYSSIREAITDADALIEKWQQKGRWLTVEDMNCHYVVPCNPNWVNTVNKVLAELETYEQSDTRFSKQESGAGK